MSDTNGMSREQVWRLADALCRGAGTGPCFNYDPAVTGGCSRCEAQIRDDLAPTVAAMLADARAEVVRDVLPLIPETPPTWVEHDGGWSHSSGLQCDQCPGYPHTNCVHPRRLRVALARHMPAAVREGGAERSGAPGDSGGPSDAAGPSGGRTEPQRLEDLAIPDLTPEEADAFLAALEGDPTCGEALGDMRCQLKRGHGGQHEDWSGV